MSTNPSTINRALWRAGRFVRAYDRTDLLPAEAVLLARYHEQISGRVLDVGSGAGRILGYLIRLDAAAIGLDIAPAMVEHCRRRFPGADVRVGDLADLAATVSGPFDAILMTDNVIDVFGDEERRRIFSDLRALLAPDGLLLFSTHNLDGWDEAAQQPRGSLQARAITQSLALARRSVGSLAFNAAKAPVKWRNRRRLAPLQSRNGEYAVINDSAHDYGLLHYYIGRCAQERQLAEAGLATVEVVERDGTTLAANEPGTSPSLFYVARAIASAG